MTIPPTSLQRQLRKDRCDALLLNTSEVLTSINLRYLTGFTGSDAAVLINGTERHLFTDGRYKTQAGQEAQGYRIHVTRNKLAALAGYLRRTQIKRVAIEGPRVSYEFAAALTAKLPSLELIPLNSRFLDTFRIKKSLEEKGLIKEAAAIASDSCRETIASGLVGKKESEVAAEFEAVCRRKGAEGMAFETIVASGPRSALPHGRPSDKIIGPGEFVIIDFGCRTKGYHSDETVTCVTGRPSDQQTKMHQAVYEAHNRALEASKPGVKTRRLDTAAREVLEKAGFGKFFLHGLGHGVGLEIHEPPRLSPRGSGVLEEGMVFTIEPGVYIEGVGGVRLESLVYLAGTGPEVLSGMPKELIMTD